MNYQCTAIDLSYTNISSETFEKIAKMVENKAQGRTSVFVNPNERIIKANAYLTIFLDDEEMALLPPDGIWFIDSSNDGCWERIQKYVFKGSERLYDFEFIDKECEKLLGE